MVYIVYRTEDWYADEAIKIIGHDELEETLEFYQEQTKFMYKTGGYKIQEFTFGLDGHPTGTLYTLRGEL